MPMFSTGLAELVLKDAVCAYYTSFGEREWQRLTNPDDSAVEFALTKQLLATYLAPPAVPAQLLYRPRPQLALLQQG
jgi:hypothetical protein